MLKIKSDAARSAFAPARLAQQRSCQAYALAAGNDPLRLQSRVQLLDEDFQGQYMIGALPLYLRNEIGAYVTHDLLQIAKLYFLPHLLPPEGMCT